MKKKNKVYGKVKIEMTHDNRINVYHAGTINEIATLYGCGIKHLRNRLIKIGLNKKLSKEEIMNEMINILNFWVKEFLETKDNKVKTQIIPLFNTNVSDGKPPNYVG